MKQLFRLLLPALFFASTFTSKAQNIIAQSTSYHPGWYTSLENDLDWYNAAGQTFRASSTSTMGTIEFYMSTVYAPGTVNLEIYSCSATNSWGSLLNTVNGVSVTAAGWISVNVSTLNIPVISGNYYGFKLIPQFGLNAGIGIASSAYADGQSWETPGFGGDDFPFKVTENVTLPVRFVDFSVQKQNNRSLLQWSTADNQHAQFFVIQHSSNGIEWNNVATVPAKDNSNATNVYKYEHPGPANGMNYYRINETDVDGRHIISGITMLRFNREKQFSVITNPVFNGQVRVLLNKPTQLYFYSANGRLLWQREAAAGIQTIPVSTYAKGLYLLKGDNITEKIMIQ